MFNNETQAARGLCKHEAGHYVIGVVNGFDMGTCKVRLGMQPGARHGESEIFPFQPLLSPSDVQTYIRRRIEVLYAGCLAEAELGGKVVESVFSSCIRQAANQDHAKARELLYVLGNFCAPVSARLEQRKDFANKLDLEVLNAAESKVLANIERINKVADALRAKLTAFDVDAALTNDEINLLLV